MKPKAARLYPHEVKAVGVAVNSFSSDPEAKAYAKVIERVMSRAVLECYEDGETDPDVIKARMNEARSLV
jgi:hypothetical protein